MGGPRRGPSLIAFAPRKNKCELSSGSEATAKPPKSKASFRYRGVRQFRREAAVGSHVEARLP